MTPLSTLAPLGWFLPSGRSVVAVAAARSRLDCPLGRHRTITVAQELVELLHERVAQSHGIRPGLHRAAGLDLDTGTGDHRRGLCHPVNRLAGDLLGDRPPQEEQLDGGLLDPRGLVVAERRPFQVQDEDGSSVQLVLLFHAQGFPLASGWIPTTVEYHNSKYL